MGKHVAKTVYRVIHITWYLQLGNFKRPNNLNLDLISFSKKEREFQIIFFEKAIANDPYRWANKAKKQTNKQTSLPRLWFLEGAEF